MTTLWKSLRQSLIDMRIVKDILKMHFFHDRCVSSAIAPGIALAPASMQSSVLESSCIGIYTRVLGFGFLHRSISCIHAVVCAGLPSAHEKITIFRDVL